MYAVGRSCLCQLAEVSVARSVCCLAACLLVRAHSHSLSICVLCPSYRQETKEKRQTCLAQLAHPGPKPPTLAPHLVTDDGKEIFAEIRSPSRSSNSTLVALRRPCFIKPPVRMNARSFQSLITSQTFFDCMHAGQPQ